MTRIDDVMLMAYVDGEVDAQTAREIEAALAADPVLSRRVAMFRQTASVMRGAYTEVLHEPLPERLTSLLRGARISTPAPAAIAEAAPSPPVEHPRIVPFDPRPTVATSRRSDPWRTAAWAAAAAISAVTLFAAGTQSGWVRFVEPTIQPLASNADSDRWLDNLAAWYRVHLSSYQKEQRLLVDVGAENIGELEKWMSAKLHREISVPDLAPFGFRQQGGRLLLISGRPAAQFFYEGENGELVQLVVGVTDQTDRSGRLDRREEVNIVSWREKGYAYAFVGRIDGQRLWRMADLTWAKLKPI